MHDLAVVRDQAAADDLIVAVEHEPPGPAVPEVLHEVDQIAREHLAGRNRHLTLQLRPTEVLLFGNPKLGTPLMQANRHIAIDLPMRVLVWEDDASKVWIGYTPPQTLKIRYKIEGRDDVLKTMASALEAFTRAAAD